MGVTTSDNDEQAAGEMAAVKPKERQFQVVPVPGTFTRGRWKCWDYKDKTSETGEIIDFTDKSEKPPATVHITENAAAYVASAGTLPEAMKNTLSEPRLMPTTDSSAAISQPIDVPNARKESSTIVVTSIAPPSITPIHGTPSSPNISPVINHADAVHEPKGGISAVGAGDHVPSCENPPTLPSIVSAPALSKIPVTVTTNTTEITPQVGAIGQIYVTSSATTPNLQPLQEIPDPNLAGQPPLAPSFASEPAVATMPLSLNENEDPTATSASATGPNVVAIDNKIEQAMDLVKTHLTFAVREEVEILRSTIVELEAKVAQLESQNQVLKQFAPMEVVNSLALLVQQHQQQQKQMQLQQQQQQLPSGAITPIPGQATQGIQQQQSMPVIQSEAPVSATALIGQSASAGLLTEVQQPVVEQQQQQQQFNVQGGLGEAGKEQ